MLVSPLSAVHVPITVGMHVHLGLALMWVMLSTLFVAIVLVGGAYLFRALEDWRWFDAMYFSAVTATTVG